jgi:hypothetical protein
MPSVRSQEDTPAPATAAAAGESVHDPVVTSVESSLPALQAISGGSVAGDQVPVTHTRFTTCPPASGHPRAVTDPRTGATQSPSESAAHGSSAGIRGTEAAGDGSRVSGAGSSVSPGSSAPSAPTPPHILLQDFNMAFVRQKPTLMSPFGMLIKHQFLLNLLTCSC